MQPYENPSHKKKEEKKGIYEERASQKVIFIVSKSHIVYVIFSE
jgi:hypothetical protein